MNNQNLLTIVVPVYNAEKYLITSLDSIKYSSYKNYRVIIVENGSTDNSLELLERYVKNDNRFELFTFSNNNLLNALNFGIENSKTKYTAIMDSDDICDKYRFERQINYLEKNITVVLVGTPINYFLKESNNRRWNIKLPIEHNEIIEGIKNQMQMLFNPTIMFRTEIGKLVGLYKKEDFPVPDLGFFLNISKYGKLANLSKSSQAIRLTDESFTAKNFDKIVFKQNKILINHFGKNLANNISKDKIFLYSKILYRKSIIYYLSKKHFLFIISIIVAFLLEPRKGVKYLINKVLLN